MEIATPLMATPAPLVETPALETPAVQGAGLPLQFLNQLLQKLGVTRLQSLADLLPAGRILVLALLAGIALRLTGATLGAINEIPLLGGAAGTGGLGGPAEFSGSQCLQATKTC